MSRKLPARPFVDNCFGDYAAIRKKTLKLARRDRKDPVNASKGACEEEKRERGEDLA